MKDSEAKFLIAGLAGSAFAIAIIAAVVAFFVFYLSEFTLVDGQFIRVHDRSDGPEVAELWAGYQARYQEEQRKLDAAIAEQELDSLYETVPLHDDTRLKLYVERDFVVVGERLGAQLAACETPLDYHRYSQHIESLCGFTSAEEPVELLAVLDAWVEARPDSHHARLIRGGFGHQYYWSFHGYPRTKVSLDEGWVDAYSQLARAKEDLLAAAKLNPKDPEPHALLIGVWASLREDQQKIDTSFENAVALAPYHYDAHVGWIHYGQPTFYGGSWRLADERSAKTAAKGDGFPLLSTLEFYSKEQRPGATGENYANYHEEHLVATEALLDRTPGDLHLMADAACHAIRVERLDRAAHWFSLLGNVYPEGSAFSNVVEYHEARVKASGANTQ